jgi:hypothetical protein
MKLCPFCNNPLVAVWTWEEDSHWECEHCKIIKVINNEKI